jgi:PBP1b-binding outer membrane lipoprotein LpoB
MSAQAKRKEPVTRYVTVLFTVLLLVGCGGAPQAPQAKAPAPDTTAPAVTEVSFSKDVQPIIAASCMPCHAADGKAARYDLTSYDKVMALVVAGKADSSKIFDVLNQGKMPPAGKLDSARLATIQQWIDAGAKNN